MRPSSYKLARAALLSGATVPPHVMHLDRPLHIVLTPESTPDPLHRERKLADTGSNILSVEQFKQGSRL